MTILNFVTQDELDNLDEDPRMAFMGLVNHAQRSLSQQLSRLDPENENEWRQREEIQQKFMNVVVAAGKRLEVEPFSSTIIPRNEDYRTSDYRQFQSDLDHFLTQLVLDNSIRSKKTSVEILPESKEKIRSYLYGLRTCVEKPNISENKKSKLMDKLDSFEKELERRRVNIIAVTLLSFEILAIPGSVWASAEVAQKLLSNITQVFAEAKNLEDQTRQIAPINPPKALSAPRPPKEQPKGSDLDDEIPF